MRIPVVIPFKPINPKSRLSCVLSGDEREQFALCMLRDVIDAARSAGCDPLILTTAPFSIPGCTDIRIEILDQGLNEALDTFCMVSSGPLAIIMADLALVDRSSLLMLMSSGSEMAIAPGTGGGTNAVYIKYADRFRAQYYGGSFQKHLRFAGDAGLTCSIVDSFRLYCDVDEQEDLVEVLLHNTGYASEYLRSLGFQIELKKSRIGVIRVVPEYL
ncbi:MAG: 2-phospho-L-lactate guanylyltransferase [Methanobacteriota archaeon]